ncbi:MAG: AAA family ATPase [Gammaproteobacteria bacterium]
MIEETTDRPAYLEHYDLNTTPFRNEIDDQFFYAGSTLMQRLDLLSHLTQFGDAVIVVTGPDGSGKTTLAQYLNKTAKTDWTMCNLAASQAEQFQHILAAHLGGYPDAPAKLLITEWINRSNDNDLLVVMVDDAQLLTPEGMKRLSVLFEENIIDRTRLLLFGTDDLSEKVHAALDSDIFKNTAQILEMPRFTTNDTSAYLLHRMAVAGYSGGNPFTETEIQAINKAADGRPLEINRQAEICLIEGHGRSNLKASVRHNKPANLPLISSLVAGAVLLAGIVGWLLKSPTVEKPALVANHQQRLAVPPADKPVPAKSLATAPESVARENTGLIARTPPEIKKPPETTRKLEKSATAQPIVNPSQTTNPARELVLEKTTDTPPQITTETQENQQPDEPSTEVTTPVIVQKPESAIQPTQIAKAEPEPEPAIVPVEEIKQSNAKISKEIQLPVAQTGDKLSLREAWLIKQKPGNYTLQLLGSRNEKAVRKFIRDQKLSRDKTAYYRGKYKGKDWFVVVYGAFKDKAAAVQQIKSLPESIRKATPWPRKMKSVQESIQSVQRQ